MLSRISDALMLSDDGWLARRMENVFQFLILGRYADGRRTHGMAVKEEAGSSLGCGGLDCKIAEKGGAWGGCAGP